MEDSAAEEITIPMTFADAYRSKNYGVLYSSLFVYCTAGSSAPTRIDVWSNLIRPNARNGQSIRWGQCGPIDGGSGRYLDPNNDATDESMSVIIHPEASVISAHGDGTGSEASGQVYEVTGARLRSGDRLALILPDSTIMHVKVRLTNNGHGVAK